MPSIGGAMSLRNWKPDLTLTPRAEADLEVCRLIVDHVDPAVQDVLLDAIARLVKLERAAAVDAHVNEDKHRALVAEIRASVARLEGTK